MANDKRHAHEKAHPKRRKTRAREGPGRAQRRPQRRARADRRPASRSAASGPRIVAAGAATFREILARDRPPGAARPPPGSSELMHSTLPTIALDGRPDRRRLHGHRRRSRTSRRSACARRRRRSNPTSERINPISGAKNLLGPEHRSSRRSRRSRRSAVVGAVAALALLPGPDRARRHRRHHPRARSASMLGGKALGDRPARRVRLPADRR